MRDGRSAGALRRPILPTVLIAGALLAMIAAPAAAAPAGHPARSTPTARPSGGTISRVFGAVETAYVEASLGPLVLAAADFPNGTTALALWNLTSGATVIVGNLSGGPYTSVSRIAAAGGKFFVAVENATTGKSSFLKVSKAGVATAVALPLNHGAFWTFPFGNATSLWAASSGALLDLNPSTFGLLANYSSAVGVGVQVYQALPTGGSVYLAGSLVGAKGASAAYFGVLTPSTGTIVRISGTHYLPVYHQAAFYDEAIAHGTVYVGGGVDAAVPLVTAGGIVLAAEVGYLYEYNLSSGAFTNHSALVPAANDTVWAIEPWKATVELTAEAYVYTPSSGWQSGGIYTLNAGGKSLTNRSGKLPSGFLPDFAFVTSETDGYLEMAGFDAAGNAELAAVPV